LGGTNAILSHFKLNDQFILFINFEDKSRNGGATKNNKALEVNFHNSIYVSLKNWRDMNPGTSGGCDDATSPG
jgi:hypothetical protein